MAQQEETQLHPIPPPPPPPTYSSEDQPPETSAPPFDPSRMIGIIKRKALIKELAAVYHAECLAHCRELLELQKNWEEPFVDAKVANDMKKEMTRPKKRVKKSR